MSQLQKRLQIIERALQQARHSVGLKSYCDAHSIPLIATPPHMGRGPLAVVEHYTPQEVGALIGRGANVYNVGRYAVTFNNAPIFETAMNLDEL